MRSLCWNHLRRIFQFEHRLSSAFTSSKQPIRDQSSCHMTITQPLPSALAKISPHIKQLRSLTTDVSTRMKTKVGIEEDGRQLLINTDDNECIKFHSVWLRFNCHCPACKQEHSGQKTMDVADIDINEIIKTAQFTKNGEVLKIQWSDHEGEIPIEFLIENSYFENENIERFSWIRKQTLPIMTFDDMTGSKNGVLRWLCEINDSGSCLLTDVPTEDKIVAKVAEHMAPVQHTIYGTTFEVRSVPNPINVAYSTVHLDFHMDLVYYESPPGIQFLHCMQFDDCVEGGESLLLDVFHVAELFRNQHPDEFRTLTKIPATFQKIHYNRDYPVDIKYQRPHIVLNNKEEIVCVNWAPAFEGPLSVSQEDVVPYYKAYHKFAEAIKYSPEIINMKLKPGDLLAFNNRRILHGRKEFKLNGGVRYLQGCYVNIDEFKSQINVLSTLTGDRKPVKGVGNQCWLSYSKR